MKTKKVKVFPKNSIFAGFAKHSRAESKEYIKDLIKNLNKAEKEGSFS